MTDITLADFDDYIQQKKADRLQSQLDMARSRPNPEQDVEVLTLSDRSGLPPETVERNLDRVRLEEDRPREEALTLINSAPRTAQWLSQGTNALSATQDVPIMRSLESEIWERTRRPTGAYNNLLHVLEVTNDITGNAIEFGGTVATEFDELLGLAGMDNRVSGGIGDVLTNVGKGISEGSLGYTPSYTFDRFWEDKTAGNFIGMFAEQGPAMLPYTVAAVFTPWLLRASLSQQFGEEIAEFRGKEDPGAIELAQSIPLAAFVAFSEKLGGEGMFGLGSNALGSGLKWWASEVGKSALIEGGTEAIQEFAQYYGTRIFTDEETDIAEAGMNALAGLTLGSGMGGAMRSVSAPIQSVSNRYVREKANELQSANDRATLTSALDKIREMRLSQNSPEQLRGYLENLFPDDRIYVSPEAVQAAIDNGEAVPEILRTQIAENPSADAVVSMAEWGAEIMPSQELEAALMPHIKTRPDGLTEEEQNVATKDRMQEWVQRAANDRELMAEVEEFESRLVDDLVATGRYTPGEASAALSLNSQYVATAIARVRDSGNDISVSEFYDDYRLRIDPEVQDLSQASEPVTLQRDPSQDEIIQSIPPEVASQIAVRMPERMEDGQVELRDVPADEALAELQAERSAYEQLLDCVRGAA